MINQNGTVAAATHAGILAMDLGGELEGDLAANLHNVTASALRINVTYRNVSATTGDDTTVSCGIAWVSNDAFGIGGTSLPDPSTDSYDWMFWDTRTLGVSRDVTDVDEMVANGFMQINNNSMRKQRENHSTLAILFRCTLLQQTTLQVFVGGRTLFIFP